MPHKTWKSYHTLSGMILLICLISVFKNPFIFFKDYASAFELTNFEYSIILLSLYLGNITSLFFGAYVNNLFEDQYQNIAALFSFISGILAALFVLIEYLKTISSHSTLIITSYGSIIAFLYKNTASICYATVVGLASDWSSEHSNGANIAYLQLSWSLSTLLFIPIGFMLQYLSWYIPFLSFAAILIFYSLIIVFCFSFSSKHDSPKHVQQINDVESTFSKISDDIRTNLGDLKTIFSKHVNLILLSIFFVSIAHGSFLITTSSFWMEDVFNLDTSSVGFVTLSIFAAEVIGALIMAQISDKMGIFVCSFVAFLIQIISSLIILNLSLVFGPTIGGLWTVIFLNFFLFVGWEIFFIAQILAMIEFGPKNISKNVILISNFAVASVAKMIGAECSALLWFNGDGLWILSALWLIANVFGCVCYAILYTIRDKRQESFDYHKIEDAVEVNTT